MQPHSRKPLGTVAYMGGVPAVLEQFCWSWGKLIEFNTTHVIQPNEFIHYTKAKHSLHDVARNQLAEAMLGNWILMLDTDHAFEPDLLCRLLAAMNRYRLDVITGIYLKKEWPNRPTIWKWAVDRYAEIIDWDPTEALEVDAAGAGCLLIKYHVFDKIRQELGEEPFSRAEFGPRTGEDFAFWKRLVMLNVPRGVVPWVECHHLKVTPLTVKDHYDPTVVMSHESDETRVQAQKFLVYA